METELWILEEDSQENLHPNGVKATLKKITNWKTLGLDGIYGFWFEKFTSIHDRLATKMNKCMQKNWDIRIDDRRGDHSNPKRPTQKKFPNQL